MDADEYLDIEDVKSDTVSFDLEFFEHLNF